MSLGQPYSKDVSTSFEQPRMGRLVRQTRYIDPRNNREIPTKIRPRFTFHAEDQYASGKHKRPRGPRADSRVEILALVAADRPEKPLTSLRQDAYDFFVVCHLQSIDNIAKEDRSKDSLLALVTQSKADLISTAVTSLSIALFSRSGRSDSGILEANASYASLIPQLRLALVTLEPEDLEICLVVVFFMALYEDAIYKDNPQEPATIGTLKSARHHDGLLILLARWAALNRTPSVIVKHARRACLKAVLMRHMDFPEFLRDGEKFGERSLDLKYDRVMVRILAARGHLYGHSPPISGARLTDLHHELRNFDVLLQAWTLEFPADWRPRTEQLPPLESTPNPRFYTDTIHIPATKSASAAWVNYYVERLLLSGMRLNALNFDKTVSPSIREALRQELLGVIKTSALNLACTLPFILGRVKTVSGHSTCDIASGDAGVDLSYAAGLITPLAVASGLRHVDAELRTWFKSQLTEMGHSLGYGLLQSVSRRDWLEF